MNYQLPLIAGSIVLYLFIYYAAGSIVVRLFPADDFSIARTFLLGFFACFFLFGITALPMKLLLLPLSLLAHVWAAVLILIVVLFLLSEKRQWRIRRDTWKALFTGKQRYITIIFLALVLLQLFLVNMNGKASDTWNQAYYLGDVSTSLYTDTISQYDPFTGKILEYLNPEYLLETYQNHGSVMCYLLNIHPMAERLTVMVSVVLILYQLLFFEIGCFLFKGSRAKSLMLTGFLALLNVFSYNEYTAAGFLISRASDGKSILAVLIIPALLYFFMKTSQSGEQKCWWIYSFLTILSSFGLNMSSIFMIPFEISALYIPLALHQKKPSVFGRFLLLLLPCAVMILLYLLTKNEFLIYTGK